MRAEGERDKHTDHACPELKSRVRGSAHRASRGPTDLILLRQTNCFNYNEILSLVNQLISTNVPWKFVMCTQGGGKNMCK